MSGEHDPTPASLLEILGIDPTHVIAATIYLRRAQPATAEIDMFVTDNDGKIQISGQEAITTEKRFTVTEIVEEEQ